MELKIILGLSRANFISVSQQTIVAFFAKMHECDNLLKLQREERIPPRISYQLQDCITESGKLKSIEFSIKCLGCGKYKKLTIILPKDWRERYNEILPLKKGELMDMAEARKAVVEVILQSSQLVLSGF